MKLKIQDAKNATLWVSHYSQHEDIIPVRVNLGSMMYWYPFNFLYYYEEMNSGKVKLRKQRRARYAVYGSNLQDLDYYSVMDKEGDILHVHKENSVYKRNKEVVDFAHNLDIPSIEDHYTLDTVQDGFRILNNWQIDKKHDILIREDLYDPLKQPEGEFGLEISDGKLFSSFTKEDTYNYQLSGEAYAMLVLMNKIVSKD